MPRGEQGRQAMWTARTQAVLAALEEEHRTLLARAEDALEQAARTDPPEQRRLLNRAAALDDEAKALAGVIDALAVALGAVTANETALRVIGRTIKTRRRTGRWANDYDACTCCGLTEREHQGRGLCSSCGSPRHPQPCSLRAAPPLAVVGGA